MANWLEKARYFIECLQSGKSLTDPAVWGVRASRIDAVQRLLVALVALLAAFGYKLDISVDDLSALAVGVSVAANLLSQASALIHTAANKELGAAAPRGFDPSAIVRARLAGALALNAVVVALAAAYIAGA